MLDFHSWAQQFQFRESSFCPNLHFLMSLPCHRMDGIHSTGASCSDTIERLPGVDRAWCNTSALYDGYAYNISFVKFATFPVDNNIHYHNGRMKKLPFSGRSYSFSGNPSIDMFHCDISQISGDAVCNITDVVNTNLRGNELVIVEIWLTVHRIRVLCWERTM